MKAVQRYDPGYHGLMIEADGGAYVKFVDIAELEAERDMVKRLFYLADAVLYEHGLGEELLNAIDAAKPRT